MARGNPNLKGMTDEERRAYYREATRRWRERNPGYWEKIGKPRRESRMAAETAEERRARREKEYEYESSMREHRNEKRRSRRSADPQKYRQYEAEWRSRNIEKIRAKSRERAKRYYPKRKADIMARNKQRRAKIRGAERSETIRLDVLANRDGWKCHICGGKVNRKDWSMDHLIPLSKGGDHTYENVSLAHGLCNKLRQAGKTPAQLLLMG